MENEPKETDIVLFAVYIVICDMEVPVVHAAYPNRSRVDGDDLVWSQICLHSYSCCK